MPSTSRSSWPRSPGARRIAGRTATGLAGAAALSLLAACGGSSTSPGRRRFLQRQCEREFQRHTRRRWFL